MGEFLRAQRLSSRAGGRPGLSSERCNRSDDRPPAEGLRVTQQDHTSRDGSRLIERICYFISRRGVTKPEEMARKQRVRRLLNYVIDA